MITQIGKSDPPTRLTDLQLRAAANLVRALAVSNFARDILAHEQAQLTRHLASIGLDAPCECEDCRVADGRGNYKYPQAFYAIARQLVQFDAEKREAMATGEKRVAACVKAA